MKEQQKVKDAAAAARLAKRAAKQAAAKAEKAGETAHKAAAKAKEASQMALKAAATAQKAVDKAEKASKSVKKADKAAAGEGIKAAQCLSLAPEARDLYEESSYEKEYIQRYRAMLQALLPASANNHHEESRNVETYGSYPKTYGVNSYYLNQYR